MVLPSPLVDPDGSPRGSEFLTDLVVERLLLADDVAAAKFLTDSSVDDPTREELVLEHVRGLAGAAGLDPDTVAAFFRDQFAASKLVQEGLFACWAAHPAQAPTAGPDLNGVRDQLDLLTARLLRALRAAERPGGDRLAGAAGPRPERLDALHHHALTVATRSVCGPGGEPPVRRAAGIRSGGRSAAERSREARPR